MHTWALVRSEAVMKNQVAVAGLIGLFLSSCWQAPGALCVSGWTIFLWPILMKCQVTLAAVAGLVKLRIVARRRQISGITSHCQGLDSFGGSNKVQLVPSCGLQRLHYFGQLGIVAEDSG